MVGMDDDAAGERLVGVERDLVALAEVAGDLGVVAGGAEDVGPAALALEADLGAGEVARGQQRRRQAVLRGAAGMEALGHRSEHLAQAHRLRRGEPERPHHLLLGQAEGLAAGRRRAEDSGRAGDVPAAVVVGRIHRIADAAFHLDAEHHRVEEVGARLRAVLRQGQQRRDDRPGRVDHRLEVRVVEVEDVRADAVHQRRVQHVHSLAPAEHRGLRRTRERRQRADGGIERLVARSAHGAAGPVEQRPLRFLPDRRRNVGIGGADDVAGQGARDARARLRRAALLLDGSRRYGADRWRWPGETTEAGERHRAHETAATWGLRHLTDYVSPRRRLPSVWRRPRFWRRRRSMIRAG